MIWIVSEMNKQITVPDSSLLALTRSAVPAVGEGGTRGQSWGFLGGTDKEASQVHQILNANNYSALLKKGNTASEEYLKRIGVAGASPKVLHLATHGFFFSESEESEEGQEPVFKLSDNPMIRSGLVLAGANYVWKSGEALPGREDGILTAYEISQMNLTNTELVVLSACETGLGDIKGNEGVFGLQRAFKMAGARYLIMSLWQVPDLPTQDLMVTFYEKWLEEGLEIPEAFRSAQQEMREKHQDPYLWAGFVLVE